MDYRQIEPYREMREAGQSPEAVYQQAMQDGYRWYNRLDIIQAVFGLKGDGALVIARQGDRAVFARYEPLREAGMSPHDITVQARADGRSTIDCIQLLRHLFGYSGVEAKRIVLAA